MIRCNYPKCITKLSKYNKNKYCFAHVAKGLFRDAEIEERLLKESIKKRKKCYCHSCIAADPAPLFSFYTCIDCKI